MKRPLISARFAFYILCFSIFLWLAGIIVAGIYNN